MDLDELTSLECNNWIFITLLLTSSWSCMDTVSTLHHLKGS